MYQAPSFSGERGHLPFLFVSTWQLQTCSRTHFPGEASTKVTGETTELWSQVSTIVEKGEVEIPFALSYVIRPAEEKQGLLN